MLLKVENGCRKRKATDMSKSGFKGHTLVEQSEKHIHTKIIIHDLVHVGLIPNPMESEEPNLYLITFGSYIMNRK